jgi:hypothetical protein
LATFVRAAAIFVGLMNAAMFGLIPDVPHDEALMAFPGDLPPWPDLSLYALSAVVAGLLVSEIVLRFMRPALLGDFYVRYWVMALAVFLGGVLLGALIISASVLLDEATTVENKIAGLPFRVVFGAMLGGVLGFAEGFVLAIPLAAALGPFRES